MGNGSDDVDLPVAAADEVAVAVWVFQMLSDATRVRLLRALSSRPHELSVNELAEAVGKHPATVSQHLAKPTSPWPTSSRATPRSASG